MNRSRPTVRDPWYRGATKDQWRAFWSAYLGWVLDVMDLVIFSMVLSYIIEEWDTGRGAAGMIVSFTLIASAFGGMIFGYIADRFGRTRAMVASILCYSIGTFLCGFSTGFVTLMAARIIVGLGVGGEWGAGTALVSETWPARHRGKVLAWVQSAFATGYGLAALLAFLVVPTLGWRWAFFIGVFPAILAFWVRREAKEPEIWLQAGERLGIVATLRMLFTRYPKPTAVCLAFTATAMCGYWGLFTWIPNYLASPVDEGGRGMDMLTSTTWIVVMQIGAAAGFVSFGYVADRIGRRNTFVLYFLAAVLSIPIFLMLDNPAVVFAFGPVMALFGTGFYSGFGPTFAELFPTEIRAFAQGFIYNAGRATSALAPAMVGFLATTSGVGMAMMGTALFYLLAAVIVFFFLPETRGRELETGTAPTSAQKAAHS